MIQDATVKPVPGIHISLNQALIQTTFIMSSKLTSILSSPEAKKTNVYISEAHYLLNPEDQLTLHQLLSLPTVIGCIVMRYDTENIDLELTQFLHDIFEENSCRVEQAFPKSLLEIKVPVIVVDDPDQSLFTVYTGFSYNIPFLVADGTLRNQLKVSLHETLEFKTINR